MLNTGFLQISSSFIEHFNEQIPQGIPCTEPEPFLTDGTISMTYRRMSQESDNSRPPCVDSMASLSSNSNGCPVCNESYRSMGKQSVEFLNCDHKECQLCLTNMLRLQPCQMPPMSPENPFFPSGRPIEITFIILIRDSAAVLDSLASLCKLTNEIQQC